jgi:hypothetical protein
LTLQLRGLFPPQVLEEPIAELFMSRKGSRQGDPLHDGPIASLLGGIEEIREREPLIFEPGFVELRQRRGDRGFPDR